MELTFACPKCSSVNRVGSVESADFATCGTCSEARGVHRLSFDTEGLRSCPLCSTEEMYIQKDFPQALGLTIVIVGFVISSVFWYYERPLMTYAILMASALLDLAVFYRVPDVTICYRCLSQVRGLGANPSGRFKPFDLAVGERFRQERIRVQEIRERTEAKERADAPPSSH